MMCAKPKRADPKQPHWIVKCMSKSGPVVVNRLHFTHASEDAANTEAQRLAETCPGKRFAVYGSCASFKIAKPEPQQPAIASALGETAEAG